MDSKIDLKINSITNNKKTTVLLFTVWYYCLSIPSLTTINSIIPTSYFKGLRFITLLLFVFIVAINIMYKHIKLTKNEFIVLMFISLSGYLSKDYHLIDLALVYMVLKRFSNNSILRIFLINMIILFSLTVILSALITIPEDLR